LHALVGAVKAHMAASAFRGRNQAHIRRQLAGLIPRLAPSVVDGDELGNFELAMAWATENFKVHQFLDTNPSTVLRDYAAIREKLRIHSRLEAAEALRCLTDGFLSDERPWNQQQQVQMELAPLPLRALSRRASVAGLSAADVKAAIDSAEPRAALIELIVAASKPKSGQPQHSGSAGRWRFPTSDAMDLSFSVLSLLLHLSESPEHTTHVAVPLECLRERLNATSPDDLQSGSDSSSDVATDEEPVRGGEDSLSDWSNEDDGEDIDAGTADADDAGGQPPVESLPSPRRDVASDEERRASAATAAVTRSLHGTMPRTTQLVEYGFIRWPAVAESVAAVEGGKSDLTTACSLARAVARHRAEAMEYDTTGTYSTTTEWLLVREVALLLLGEPGSMFELVGTDVARPQGFRTRHKLQLLHLSPSALWHALAPLMSVANDLLRIRCFCDFHIHYRASAMDNPRSCATIQAFAHSIRRVLDEETAWLLQLDAQMLRDPLAPGRASDGSLLRFTHRAGKLMSVTDQLKQLLSAALPASMCGTSGRHTWQIGEACTPAQLTTRVLDTLYASSRQADGLCSRISVYVTPMNLAGRTLELPLSLRILVETIRPYLLLLDGWLDHGLLRDTYGEFCIYAQASTTSTTNATRAAEFWGYAYKLRTAAGHGDCSAASGGCVPAVLQDVAADMLTCGKSILVCSEDCSALQSGADQTSYRAVTSRQSISDTCRVKLANQLAAPAAHTNLVSIRKPTSTEWQSCVVATIRARCLEASRSLVLKLLREHQLRLFLDALRGAFFMGDGLVMSEICTHCYGRLERGEPLDGLHHLRSLFQMVLGLRGRLPASVDLSVNSKVLPSARLDIHALDTLSVEYEAPWPISIIITKQCLEVYNVVMRLLLQVKRAKHTLDGLFLRRTRDRSTAKGRQMKVPHEVCLFQVELTHFVNNLHLYLMNRLSHCAWETLQSKLEVASNVDSLIAAHESYLHTLHDQCFLSDKATYVLDAITKILGIVLEMRERCEQRSRLGDLQVRFRRLHKLLMHVLQAVVHQGTDTAHFEDLAMRLNFNRYYAT
jgi:hypothetical protein